MSEKEEQMSVAQDDKTMQIEGPGAEIATRSAAQAMIAHIRSDAFKEQLAAALPEGITPDRFVRVTATALLQNPELPEKADHASILQAIIRCAQDGLFPDGQEAALVIYGQKAVYLPMIGGFRKIAAEHGWTLRTHLIYEHDEFDYTLGDHPTVVHKPPRVGTDRGKLIAAYAVARHRDGRVEFLPPMAEQEIAKVREASRAANRGPWKEWPERMWEKTAGRRLFKSLPLDPSDRRVASVLSAEALPEPNAEALYGPNGGRFQVLEIGELDEVSGSAGDAQPAAREQPADPPPAEGAPGPPPDPACPPDDAEPVIEGADLSEPEPEVVEGVPEDEVALTDQEREWLPRALEVRIPSGSYQQRTLRWVLDSGEAADQWFAYALRQEWLQDQGFKRALVIVVRAERPGLWLAWQAEQ